MAHTRGCWLAFSVFLIGIFLACGGSGRGANQFSGGNIGATWSKISTPSGAKSIFFFSVNSSNHWFVADRNSGFYRSTDQGATWTQINNGVANAFGWTIQVDPSTGDLIANTCSCAGLNVYPVVFYRSSDEGTTWTPIPEPTNFYLSFVGAHTGCAFASNGNLVCGGYWGQGIAWVSRNGGQTTTTAGSTPVLGSAYSIAENPVKNDLWLGTEQRGLYRSTDNGLTWVQASPSDVSLDPVNGLRIGNVYGINFDRNGNVLASSQGGIWKSSSAGSAFKWTRVLANQNSSAGVTIGRDASGNLYYGHSPDSLNPITLYRSTDDGSTWTEFDRGIPAQLIGNHFTYNPADGQMYVVVISEPTGQGWVYRTGG